jgi:hypothetical protein
MATRMPTGIGIAAGFAPLRSFLRALRYMLLPEHGPDNDWPIGVPQKIYVDRGDILHSESLALIVQQLNTQICNGHPTHSATMRKVRHKLAKIRPLGTNIQAITHLIHAFLNRCYVHKYQQELGDTPANRWRKEVGAGWVPVMLPPNKVLEMFSKLGEEDR